jgi:hypothetical protein
MSPREPGDRALDRYLQGDSTLSKIYKGASPETPPSELDAAIFVKARHAVEAHALMRRRRVLQRWMIPTSLAAALILTVGLVTFMFEHGGGPMAPKQTSEQRSRPARLPGRKLPLQQQEEAIRQPKSGTVNEPSAGKDAKTLQSDVASPPAAGSQVTPPPASAPAERGLLKEEAKRQQPLLDKTSETDQSIPRQAPGETDLTPQEWLKHIAELRKQGRLSEAQASLEEFRRRYPNYPVETILK